MILQKVTVQKVTVQRTTIQKDYSNCNGLNHVQD
jgi:hypothetical protein